MADKKTTTKLAELQQQVNELTEALQRERADAVNLRRRHEAEMAAVRARAKASLVGDLLPVIDNFERSLGHVPKELEGNDFVKGVNSIVKQFQKTLIELGVERIKTVGQPFDPNLHEAVGIEGGEGSKEVISQELQAGYKIGDDVIRHAMVKVELK